METTSTDSPPVAAGFSPRAKGACLVAAGGVLGWLCVIQPLRAAARHAAYVNFSVKGTVFVPLAFALGLTFLVLGEDANRFFGLTGKPSWLAKVILFGSLGAGVWLCFWVKQTLRSYGYPA